MHVLGGEHTGTMDVIKVWHSSIMSRNFTFARMQAPETTLNPKP